MRRNTIDPLENLIHFCFTQLRVQFEYRLGLNTLLFQYRTRSGAMVPLAFKNKEGCLGILPIKSIDRISSALGSAQSFLRTYSRSKVLILYPEAEKPQLIQSRILALSLGQVV